MSEHNDHHHSHHSHHHSKKRSKKSGRNRNKLVVFLDTYKVQLLAVVLFLAILITLIVLIFVEAGAQDDFLCALPFPGLW